MGGTLVMDAGLPAGRDRRVPGLRRSEVAMIAGVLGAIATALQPDDAGLGWTDAAAASAANAIYRQGRSLRRFLSCHSPAVDVGR
jgi:hypothetical protein